MGVKKELRLFMAEVKGELSVRNVLERRIEQLEKQNELLMDRLMSQSLRDYKINTMIPEPSKQRVPLPPEMDESLVGELWDGEDEAK